MNLSFFVVCSAQNVVKKTNVSIPQGCWAMGQEHLQESRNLGTYLEETLGWMT